MPDSTVPLPPCPPGAAGMLSRLLPQWVLGVEEERTLAGLTRGLLNLGGRSPELGAALGPVAVGCAAWNFMARPLSPEATELAAGIGPVPQRPRSLAARLHPALTRDPGLPDLLPVLKSSDPGLIAGYLLTVLKDPATGPRTNPDQGPAVLAQAWNTVLALGSPDLPPEILDAALPGTDDPVLTRLKARLEAEFALHYLAPEEFLTRVRSLDPEAWGLWRDYAMAEGLVRTGDTERALRLLGDTAAAMPWHVNLVLKLRSLKRPVPPASPEETRNAAVLLYSWNKADLLEKTLHSLAASETGEALVAVLDNGSTDETRAVLDRGETLFPGRFLRVDLPVNVGAPAARNWLLSLPEVRKRAWYAFLDDDVVLPPEWLLRLLGGARSFPESGAVGCRIKSASPPRFLQSADYNLLPAPPEASGSRVGVMDICSGRPDTGLFSYDRPALSVSGCCHLVSRRAVDAAGGFDVRFTPSQFDDLDRDLRSAMAGLPAVYLGTLAVGHVQFSSLAKAETPAKMGHVLGNKLKLDSKYEERDLRRITEESMERLWKDFHSADITDS